MADVDPRAPRNPTSATGDRRYHGRRPPLAALRPQRSRRSLRLCGFRTVSASAKRRPGIAYATPGRKSRQSPTLARSGLPSAARASLLSSEWDQVFPRTYPHRRFMCRQAWLRRVLSEAGAKAAPPRWHQQRRRRAGGDTPVQNVGSRYVSRDDLDESATTAIHKSGQALDH